MHEQAQGRASPSPGMWPRPEGAVLHRHAHGSRVRARVPPQDPISGRRKRLRAEQEAARGHMLGEALVPPSQRSSPSARGSRSGYAQSCTGALASPLPALSFRIFIYKIQVIPNITMYSVTQSCPTL